MGNSKPKRRYSWRGPAPSNEVDAYLIAMILRTYDNVVSGPAYEYQPSVFTQDKVKIVAVSVFLFKKQFSDHSKREITIQDLEKDRLSISSMSSTEVVKAKKKHRKEIALLEKLYSKYVETEKQRGFICYGG